MKNYLTSTTRATCLQQGLLLSITQLKNLARQKTSWETDGSSTKFRIVACHKIASERLELSSRVEFTSHSSVLEIPKSKGWIDLRLKHFLGEGAWAQQPSENMSGHKPARMNQMQLKLFQPCDVYSFS